MNKFVKDTFTHIKTEEAAYRNAVTAALMDYRRTMARAEKESKQYKDEASYISTKKTAAKRDAQVSIQMAENALTAVVKAEVNSLRDDLHQHLTTRPSAAFLDALRLYYDFSITPSRSEIDALMTLNGGNSLGYRALNQVLKKTNAEFTVDAPASADYEADLAALEQLAEGHYMYAPSDLYHEAVEVFEGEKRPIRTGSGEYVNTGYIWDHVGILTATHVYENKTKALDDMSDRWSSTVLPSLKHITAYRDNEETGETAAQQMAKDIRSTAHAPEIEPSQSVGERIAEEIHRGTVESYEKGQEILQKHYL